jgi:hypothetical protein
MLNLLGINLRVYNLKSSKWEFLKCRCIMKVPSGTMGRLHWPWNSVYRWIVSVWANSVFACHWKHMSLLISLIKSLCDVDVESCWWRCCWVMLMMALSRWCWLWHVVATESYWQRCCRVMLGWCCRGSLVAVLCRCRVILATLLLLSHASVVAAKASWPCRDIDIESYWRLCCWVMLAMVLPRWLACGAM